MTLDELISTGDAARILGYCPDTFRRKFLEVFQAKGAVIRQDGGHMRWSRAAVERLKAFNPQSPKS